MRCPDRSRLRTAGAGGVPGLLVDRRHEGSLVGFGEVVCPVAKAGDRRNVRFGRDRWEGVSIPILSAGRNGVRTASACGRWVQRRAEAAMGEKRDTSGKRVRPKAAPRGKRYLCAKCRKRSPVSVATPTPRYCPRFAGQPRDPSPETDVTSEESPRSGRGRSSSPSRARPCPRRPLRAAGRPRDSGAGGRSAARRPGPTRRGCTPRRYTPARRG
jgi:hypothetical protein